MKKQDFLSRVNESKKLFSGRYIYTEVPEEFKATDKITIVCRKHGAFLQKAISHTLGNNCIRCAALRDSNVIRNIFISKSKKLFGDRFSYEEIRYKDKNTKVTLVCKVHGSFDIFPNVHLRNKTGCPNCDEELRKTELFSRYIKLAKEIHNGYYSYPVSTYVTHNTPVEIHCPLHGSFEQSLYSHAVRGCKCPICARENTSLKLNSFKQRAVLIHDNKYSYDLVKFTKASDKVTIVCGIHGSFQQRVSSHLCGNGCKECFLESNRKRGDVFIEQAKALHGNKYDYSKVLYVHGKCKVEIICKKHGSFWIKPNSHTSSKQGCPRCKDSKGETLVSSVLNKHRINFIREFKIEPYSYRYDFYLPDKNILLEYNGVQHYKPVDRFGGLKEFLKLRQRDLAKLDLARKTGYIPLIISYRYCTFEDIENFLLKIL